MLMGLAKQVSAKPRPDTRDLSVLPFRIVRACSREAAGPAALPRCVRKPLASICWTRNAPVAAKSARVHAARCRGVALYVQPKAWSRTSASTISNGFVPQRSRSEQRHLFFGGEADGYGISVRNGLLQPSGCLQLPPLCDGWRVNGCCHRGARQSNAKIWETAGPHGLVSLVGEGSKYLDGALTQGEQVEIPCPSQCLMKRG